MDKATQGGTYLPLSPPWGMLHGRRRRRREENQLVFSFSLFLTAKVGTVEVKGIRTTVDAQ